MRYKCYIGLDAHSKRCVFAVMDRRGKILKQATVETNETELIRFVRSVKGPKALVFEEGSISQWLYLLLKPEVDSLVVCDPAANIKKGPKTDKVDAVELADLLRVDRLSSVFHSVDERIELRTLVSGYEDLNQEIVRAKNRYKALFRQSAIRVDGSGVYSDPQRIRELKTKTQRFVAKQLLQQIRMLEEHKELYGKKFESNIRRFKEMRLIKGMPGFGPIRANQVVGIVVSPYRFPTKYNFYSYSMIIKHDQVSDGVVYGKKKAYGRAQLKAIFKMATHDALKSDNAFKRKYMQMLKEGKTEKAARNAVTRALASTVLGVWKSGKKYKDHYREVTRRGIRNSKA